MHFLPFAGNYKDKDCPASYSLLMWKQVASGTVGNHLCTIKRGPEDGANEAQSRDGKW